MKISNFYKIILGTALILMAPLIAVILSDDVDWNWFDFLVIGTLLISAGVLYELINTKVNIKYRPLVAFIIVVTVLFISIELAVGIFSSPFAGS